LIAFSLGFILSIISVAPILIKNRLTISKQQKRIQELEKQISPLYSSTLDQEGPSSHLPKD
jgi:uncharacterized membrane protein YciS (DUF1049 family)